MDDVLYDTSLTLYTITEGTKALNALLEADQDALDLKALNLQDHLSHGRARYEDEEEHEKIGGLRDCTWKLLHHEDQPAHGVIVSLLYDKITYRFIFLAVQGNSNKRRKDNTVNPLPLLLIKASTSVTTRFLNFLSIHFQAPVVQALKLPPPHLASTLSSYITSLVAAHRPIAVDYALQAFLQDTIGSVKLTITVTSAEIAKSLRTIDVDIPTETLSQLIRDGASDPAQAADSTASPKPERFLANLQHHIHERTGLVLPLTADPESLAAQSTDAEPPPEAPLKLTRISTTAFALSSDPAGRLKLAMRSVQAVEVVPGLDSGREGNVVRRANGELLRGLLAAARAAAESQGDD